MKQDIRILALMGGAHLFGQERGNIEALAALKNQGCAVHCLIRDEAWSQFMAPGLDARGLAWTKVSFLQNFQGGNLPAFLWRSALAFVRGNLQFLRVASSFRPTHIHAPNPMYVLSFAVALLLVHQPLVFRAGDEPAQHNMWRRALWRFVMWRTTHYVAISEFIRSSLIGSGVEGDRIAVIYNYPPVRPEPLPKFSASPRSGSELVIAFIGQIISEKGPHLAIEATRSLISQGRAVRLLVAGRISDWSGDDWARDLRGRTLGDDLLRTCVQFLGHVEDVPGLLEYCDLLVVPSISNEPLGNVVMEAKLAGRPAIVFPRGGLPEMIEPGVDGYVCREPTAECLVECLKAYLTDRQLARVQGRAAKASLEKLGVLNFSTSWLAAYEAALAQPRLDACSYFGGSRR